MTTGATVFDYPLCCYAFFLQVTPIKPMRPEPNSQVAAEIGTAETVPVRCSSYSKSPKLFGSSAGTVAV